MSSADLKCPICSKLLDGSEHTDIAKRLEKNFSQRYRDLLKKDRQENADIIAKFKQNQRKQIQTMAKKYQSEKKAMQKKARRSGKEEQTKPET